MKPVESPAASTLRRIASIDIVRGVAMLLMAIDHVRVYSAQPAFGAADGSKSDANPRLARFLVTRGLWLVFLELTVLRVAWTFNFDFTHYLMAGVIWMIGCCMILLTAFVFLPAKVSGATGVVILRGTQPHGPLLPATRTRIW